MDLLNHIDWYFKEEKIEALLFGLFSLGLLLISAYVLYVSRSTFARGVIGPLVLIAIVGLIAGATVYFRTDNQVMVLKEQLMQEPPLFYQKEVGRMERVMASFDYYKIVYYIFVVGGLAGLLFIRKDLWMGMCLGLLLAGALGLLVDTVASRRGKEYLIYLKSSKERLVEQYKKGLNLSPSASISI